MNTRLQDHPFPSIITHKEMSSYAHGPVCQNEPIYFGAPGSSCFGWMHYPDGEWRDTGVVLCRPNGFDGTSVYESFVALAEQLAQAGFPCIRFDYHGTGDSAGNDLQSTRVEAWLNSVALATAELRARTGVANIAMVGVRIGATLAAVSASRQGGIASLVMWAPIVAGRTLVRELRATGKQVVPEASNGSSHLPSAAGIEALGYQYTAETIAELGVVDCTKLDPMPAKNVLILGRDDLPAEGPLPESLRRQGADVEYLVPPGYAAMVVEPHDSVVPQAAISQIIEWLVRKHPAIGVTGQSRFRRINGVPESISDGVSERPVQFGANSGLVGILTQPLGEERRNAQLRPLVLMINIGANYRVGPHRLYVTMAREWARRGYSSLRLDLAGFGDSKGGIGRMSDRLYAKSSTQDVSDAINALSDLGYSKFATLGLCSGAYVAFHTAIVDDRVTDVVLVNPRRLEWEAGETLQIAMTKSFKSTHYYARSLLQSSTYKRLLAGKIDVSGISSRMLTLVRIRLRRGLDRLIGRKPADEDVFSNMRLLCLRSVKTLLLVGNEDDGRDYVEMHFGRRGRKLAWAKNFVMKFLDGSDHTFSTERGRALVVENILSHLQSDVK